MNDKIKKGKRPGPNFVWSDSPPGWKLKDPEPGSYVDELVRLRELNRQLGLENLRLKAKLAQQPAPVKKTIKIKRRKT